MYVTMKTEMFLKFRLDSAKVEHSVVYNHSSCPQAFPMTDIPFIPAE